MLISKDRLLVTLTFIEKENIDKIDLYVEKKEFDLLTTKVITENFKYGLVRKLSFHSKSFSFLNAY